MIFQRLICKAIYYLQQLIAAHNTLLSKISNDLGLTDEQEKDRKSGRKSRWKNNGNRRLQVHKNTCKRLFYNKYGAAYCRLLKVIKEGSDALKCRLALTLNLNLELDASLADTTEVLNAVERCNETDT